MAGFQLKLNKQPAKKIGFSLGKKQATKPRKNAFGDVSDGEQENVKKEIDTFDAEEQAKSLVKPEIVIRPEVLSSKIAKPDTDATPTVTETGISHEEDQKAESHVTKNSILSKKEDGEEVTEESYKKVPVEDFGAALLRGMGWKGKHRGITKPSTEKRQHGLLLGIGAKAIKDEALTQELLSTKAKFSVPLVKRKPNSS